MSMRALLVSIYLLIILNMALADTLRLEAQDYSIVLDLNLSAISPLELAEQRTHYPLVARGEVIKTIPDGNNTDLFSEQGEFTTQRFTIGKATQDLSDQANDSRTISLGSAVYVDLNTYSEAPNERPYLTPTLKLFHFIVANSELENDSLSAIKNVTVGRIRPIETNLYRWKPTEETGAVSESFFVSFYLDNTTTCDIISEDPLHSGLKMESFENFLKYIDLLPKENGSEDLKIEPVSDETETSGYWMDKGDRLRNIGRYAESIGYYDEALKIDPANAIAWNNKGLASAKMGRYKDALHSFEQAVKVEPKYAIAWSNKGLTLNNLGMYDDALESYDKSIEIDPDEADAWSNKGLTLSYLGRYNEAIQCYDKALEINPKQADALNARCMTLINIGRHNDALQNCNRATEINASHFEAWNNRGVAQKKLGLYNEAIKSFDKAIGINPNWAIPWYNKGNVLAMLGRTAEANEAYAKAKMLGYTD